MFVYAAAAPLLLSADGPRTLALGQPVRVRTSHLRIVKMLYVSPQSPSLAVSVAQRGAVRKHRAARATSRTTGFSPVRPAVGRAVCGCLYVCPAHTLRFALQRARKSTCGGRAALLPHLQALLKHLPTLAPVLDVLLPRMGTLAPHLPVVIPQLPAFAPALATVRRHPCQLCSAWL
jgi:hypothetical protein